MELFRAQEILADERKINVELNGVAVWIDSVDTDSQQVKVHAEDNPADTRTVEAQELQEVK
ncbi:H-type small acid-soluble spore protein [Paenibacillus athensensis]|uniref:H-type small acid-soluble spore protein n=1 Tax=Paenibacillus athensensis TaxID=1967502 RepID=A0A4Y8Q7F7_9BACL|nr:H-type small acid-soluble spore protein [Paenibacillus athensensis]MCD1259560.1 H-type small acid-soluble spore protein [Paenibacillus athensensis]